MNTTIQPYKNITVLITKSPENENALVELAGMIPALQPIVENTIDIDALPAPKLHKLSPIGDAATFLRNNLDMFESVAVPSDAPATFISKLTLNQNDGTGDYLLTFPVFGADKDQSHMMYHVLPTIIEHLVESQTALQCFYEFWPRQ